MNIPGANILGMAAGLITFQTVQHRAFVSRAENAAGDTVSVFADPVDIQGSVQAINKKLYQLLGLNLAKNYVMLYTSATVKPTGRDREGDLIFFAGRTYQCESDQNWADIDGFVKMLCVETTDPGPIV